jgi:DNA-binding IclR family transcriptional regulator
MNVTIPPTPDHAAASVRPEGRYIVPALAQGLAALALFGRERPRLTAPEIAQSLSLPRSTVFRLLQTLQTLGYLHREDERYFRLGPALLNRGFAYLASLDVVQVAQPLLEALRDRTGCATQLATLDGTEILYVARVAAHTPIASNVAVGTRLPAYATAMGRVMLMGESDAAIRARFAATSLTRYTEITPTNIESLLTLLAQDRARGYVLSASNFEPGIDSLALPILDHDGGSVAALSVVGHGWDFSDHTWLEGLLIEARTTAARISQWLGASPRKEDHQ